jgi:hypothetical protein
LRRRGTTVMVVRSTEEENKVHICSFRPSKAAAPN